MMNSLNETPGKETNAKQKKKGKRNRTTFQKTFLAGPITCWAINDDE